MSLVITSNTAIRDDSMVGGINRPYSYQNHLTSTMTIKKNSKIAVQSVKINREGNISLNRMNNQLYLYYGTKLSDTLPIDDVTSHPAMTWIMDEDGNTNNVFNTDEFASGLQRSLRKGIYHPNNLVGITNTNGAKASVSRSASGLDFNGFSMSFYSSSEGGNAENLPTNWVVSHTNASFSYSVSSGARITKVADESCDVIGTDYPLSMTNGSCTFNLQNLGANWSCGLTRCTRTFRTDETGVDIYNDELQAPPYFYGDKGTFYDWELRANANILELWHAVVDPLNASVISMQQFDYTAYTTGSPINYATGENMDDEPVTTVSFSMKGEQLTILLSDDSSTKKLCDGLGADRTKTMKPSCISTWHLFPKMSLRTNGDYMTLKNWEGLNITDYQYGSENVAYPLNDSFNRQLNMDYYATQINLGRTMGVYGPDTRYMMSFLDTSKAYTQIGLNGAGAVNYDYVIITTPSDLYYKSFGASTMGILGFRNRGVITDPTAISGLTITFTSDETPKFLSTNSLFIRVPNLTHDSFNFSKTALSKILYMLPRFDNNGNEVGGLFFEPSERVYLDLNNPNDIVINELEVQLVNADETLATSLTGKTIVNFHIKD